MAELVFQSVDYITNNSIEKAIESNHYITIEDYKVEGDKITFIPMFDEAILDKFDVAQFGIHMGKELRIKFINIKE